MAIVKATYPGINPPEKTRIQVTNVVLANADVSVTAEQLLNFLLTMTPTAPRTLVLPPAADIVALLTHATAADGLEFQVRNFGAAAINTITVVPNGALSGSAVVNGGSYKNFIIRLDSVSSAAPTYTLNDMGTSGAGPGSGDVVGPASSTDNAVAVFDGVTGKIIKETLAADPLLAVTDANNNVLIGTGTAFSNIAGGAVNNTILGADAAPALTTGPRNVIIGRAGALGATTGDNNTMIGDNTDVTVATSANAVAVGAEAIAGECGVSVGSDAAAVVNGSQIIIGCSARAGVNGVTVGFSAGSVGATNSIAIGENALDDATAGKTENVAIGTDALTALTTGDNNVCVGHQAGNLLTTGIGNVLIGHDADATANTISGAVAVGLSTVAAAAAVAIGDVANAATTGAIAIGDAAAATLSPGNVAIGDGAAASGLTGSCIAIGVAAAASDVDAIAIGTSSVSAAGGSIAIGESSGGGGDGSVAVGRDAIASTAGSIAIGDIAAASAGTNNICIGPGTVANNATGRSIAIGFTADAGGAEAIAIGDVANAATTGAIAIGDAAAASVGVGNIAIGDGASASGAATCIAIGAGVANSTTLSLQFPANLTAIVGDNAARWSASGGGTLAPDSSTIRIKTDVVDLDTTLDPEALYKLRPVAFHVKENPDAPWKQYGFIAEETAKIMPQITGFGHWVNPETHVQETEITPTSVDYARLCAPIVLALQQQKIIIDALLQDMQQQKITIDTLVKKLG